MKETLLVGLGGFAGAVLRYVLSSAVQRLAGQGFPAGTLAVNVLGCLLIGALVFLVESREAFSPEVRLFALVGLLGSLTTFSTFGHETLSLLRDGRAPIALGNVAAQLALGLGAVALGRSAARLLAG